jgi:hypothetical protein
VADLGEVEYVVVHLFVVARARHVQQPAAHHAALGSRCFLLLGPHARAVLLPQRGLDRLHQHAARAGRCLGRRRDRLGYLRGFPVRPERPSRVAQGVVRGVVPCLVGCGRVGRHAAGGLEEGVVVRGVLLLRPHKGRKRARRGQ